MTSLSVFVQLPADYKFLLRQYIAFCARVSLCFLRSVKISKHWAKVTNKTRGPGAIKWCSISKKVSKALIFWKWELHGWRGPKYVISLCVHSRQVATRRIFSQKDKALLHYSNWAKTFLKSRCPKNWVRRGGPVVRKEALSLDLTLWDIPSLVLSNERYIRHP